MAGRDKHARVPKGAAIASMALQALEAMLWDAPSQPEQDAAMADAELENRGVADEAGADSDSDASKVRACGRDADGGSRRTQRSAPGVRARARALLIARTCGGLRCCCARTA